MTQLNNDRAIISVTPTGFVDGACFSNASDVDEFISDAENRGFDVRTVDRKYAKEVVFTNISINGKLLA